MSTRAEKDCRIFLPFSSSLYIYLSLSLCVKQTYPNQTHSRRAASEHRTASCQPLFSTHPWPVIILSANASVHRFSSAVSFRRFGSTQRTSISLNKNNRRCCLDRCSNFAFSGIRHLFEPPPPPDQPSRWWWDPNYECNCARHNSSVCVVTVVADADAVVRRVDWDFNRYLR